MFAEIMMQKAMPWPLLHDKAIDHWINKEKERQNQGLELIASENFVSPAVMRVMGSVLTNKYAEGLPHKRYYGGCEYVDEVEELAQQRAKQLFGVEWVNVQPHSGAQANAAVMLAFLRPGDTILGLDLSNGGHLTHGSPVNYSGKLYRSIFYGVRPDDGYVDYEQMEALALQEKPQMIIVGASAYSRDWDYAIARRIADEVGAVLVADIAHPAGLIAKGLLANPFEYCHVVTTTTHKTLRGPRGGMIMIGKNVPNPFGITTRKGTVRKMGSILDSAVFPGTQGGPLEHVIAAKAVAFAEAITDEFTQYVRQVIRNAQTMAAAFMDMGYHVVSGGTDNHLFLIDLRNKRRTGQQIETALEKAGITVNKNMVPNDNQSPMVTSGIRIGTPALTTRGMQEQEMQQIAELIDRIVRTPEDELTIRNVRQEVFRLTAQFPLYAESMA